MAGFSTNLSFHLNIFFSLPIFSTKKKEKNKQENKILRQ